MTFKQFDPKHQSFKSKLKKATKSLFLQARAKAKQLKSKASIKSVIAFFSKAKILVNATPSLTSTTMKAAS